MPKRFTQEQVKNIFKENGLTLCDNQIYTNKTVKLNCYDNNGYFYNITLDCAQDKRTKKYDIVGKKNLFSIQNIQHYIKIRNSKTEILSEKYNSSKEMLKFRCECGEEYSTSWDHIRYLEKITCNKCSYIESNKENKLSLEYIESVCLNNGYKLLDNFDQNSKEIYVEDEDGYRYKTSIYRIQKMKNKCNKFNKKNMFTVFNMLNYLKLNDINIKMVDEKERKIEVRKDMIEFYCIDCGEKFEATWGQVAYGIKGMRRLRCQRCTKSQSNLEYIIEEYLKEKQIKYEKQKRFIKCRNIRPLPFDFYLSKYKTVIEINGKQHYYENDMFDQTLQERQRIDEIKKDFCIKNNINYIEIPFWKITNVHEFKAYKNIIDNIVK